MKNENPNQKVFSPNNILSTKIVRFVLVISVFIVGYWLYQQYISKSVDKPEVAKTILTERTPLSPYEIDPNMPFNEMVFMDTMYSFSQRPTLVAPKALYSEHEGRIKSIDISKNEVTIVIINSFNNKPSKLVYTGNVVGTLTVNEDLGESLQAAIIDDIKPGMIILVKEDFDETAADYDYYKALQKITITIKGK